MLNTNSNPDLWGLHMNIRTHYFERASEEHTNDVIQIVKDFLEANPSVKSVVVATTEGSTGLAFAEVFGPRTVVVTHHQGFREPGKNEIDDNKLEQIKQKSANVLTTTHAFAGVARGIRVALKTYSPTEMLAYAYRTFGQGTKVCAEIVMMAADAGLIGVEEDVISVGGTGRGADTAWLVGPAHTNTFTHLKMRACLCKPLEF